jgi:hypothetical protein
MQVRRIQLQLHCAPLERQTQVGREVYKHLAPPEPEQRLVAVNSDAVFCVVSGMIEVMQNTGTLINEVPVL